MEEPDREEQGMEEQEILPLWQFWRWWQFYAVLPLVIFIIIAVVLIFLGPTLPFCTPRTSGVAC
jgi:thiosulfate reductase cytochrome b subunit